MSKKVARGARIILGGADISDICTRWAVIGEVGEIYMAELDLLDIPSEIEIVRSQSIHAHDKPVTAEGGCKLVHRLRTSFEDRIIVKGADVSRWVSRYDRITRVGFGDTIRL